MNNNEFFLENDYLGEGFEGACTTGITFYTGTKYPPRYRGQIFIIDYVYGWIRVLHKQPDVDIFTHIEDFADLSYVAGSKVTLEPAPNGDICYVTLNAGEVRCFQYLLHNLPPTPVCGADVTNFQTAPFTIQFNSDGTFDTENDEISLQWNFGDGATSNLANPSHQFTGNGPYTVYLIVTDSNGNSNNCSMTIRGGVPNPIAYIFSPAPNIQSPEKVIEITDLNAVISFSTQTTEGENHFNYVWDFYSIRSSYFVPTWPVYAVPSFNIEANQMPFQKTTVRNNILIVLTVSNSNGVSATDLIHVNPYNWQQDFGNKAPVPKYTVTGFTPFTARQPIRFDASETRDADGDHINYYWTWGDGFNGTGMVSSHLYDKNGIYRVTLTVIDNWGAFESLVQVVVIGTNLTTGAMEQTSNAYASTGFGFTTQEATTAFSEGNKTFGTTNDLGVSTNQRHSTTQIKTSVSGSSKSFNIYFSMTYILLLLLFIQF